jgi:predicted GNAT family acetyltransferase
VDLGGGEAAELTYSRAADGVVSLDHTYVPDSGRDKGIGKQLATAALAWAREQGLRVIPTCPYVAAFVKRHPEYADLIDTRA